jgi:hypothetical protein
MRVFVVWVGKSYRVDEVESSVVCVMHANPVFSPALLLCITPLSVPLPHAENIFAELKPYAQEITWKDGISPTGLDYNQGA